MNDIELLTETTPPLIRLMAEGIASDLSTRDWTFFITPAVAALRAISTLPEADIAAFLNGADLSNGGKKIGKGEPRVVNGWAALVAANLANYPEPEIVEPTVEEGAQRPEEPVVGQSE